jgi:hypothetical protein
MTELVFGKKYFVELAGEERKVIAVNGETEFNEVGYSQGFVHFKNPETGEQMGFCGVYWFKENAVLAE